MSTKNDGLIAEGATQMSNVYGATSIENITIDDVNHMEMAGHPKMKDKLMEIFNTSQNEITNHSIVFDINKP